MPKIKIDQLVQDAFSIDLDELAERSDISPYWQNSYVFYLSVSQKWVEEMSEDQLQWLARIENDL